MAEDLNLLTALDALLTEGSVAAAARRLGLSASAMSRTLTRLRAATGDPLLVRAGRGLVPTPRAAELRDQVHDLAQAVRAVLRPAPAALDLATLAQTFTIRANESFVDTFAARLIALAAEAAPGARLRFAPKPDKDVRPLREGLIDLEIGVLGDSAPEIRVQALFQDTFVAVVRDGHPLAGPAALTPERLAAAAHVLVSRRGRGNGPVDRALAALGLARTAAAMVPGFPAALGIAGVSDLVALAPRSYAEAEIARRGGETRAGLRILALPMPVEPITISQMWHPRLDADPAHRWLRGLMLAGTRGQGRGRPLDRSP